MSHFRTVYSMKKGAGLDNNAFEFTRRFCVEF